MIIGTAIGLVFGCGAIATVVAVVANRDNPPAVVDLKSRFEPTVTKPAMNQRRAAAALAAGVVVFTATRWPALGLAAAGLVYAVPAVISPGEDLVGYQAKTDAIAAWTESLRDTMAASRGLEGAVVVTAPTAPLAIRGDLDTLVFELDHGVSMRDGLIGLADRLRHPISDMVIATMVMAIDGDAVKISAVLSELASSSRNTAAGLVEIHSQRQSVRTTVRAVALIVVAMVAIMLVTFRAFLEPYGTAAGQVALTVILAAMGACLAWIVRLGRLEVPARFLTPGALR